MANRVGQRGKMEARYGLAGDLASFASGGGNPYYATGSAEAVIYFAPALSDGVLANTALLPIDFAFGYISFSFDVAPSAVPILQIASLGPSNELLLHSAWYLAKQAGAFVLPVGKEFPAGTKGPFIVLSGATGAAVTLEVHQVR